MKPGTSVLKASLSDREFEILLRRAAEFNKTNRLHLVKKAQPARRSPRSAARVLSDNLTIAIPLSDTSPPGSS